MVSYHIPNVEIASNALAGMSVFTKIDLKTVYHEIRIDDNFKKVTKVNTPMGLLKWISLPYGIKTESTIFKMAIEEVPEVDIKNMVCYQCDICIVATNENELRNNQNRLE